MMKKITTLLVLLMLTTFMAACAPANPANTETPSNMETVTAGPSAATGNVDELIAMVNDFVTSGDITGQAENGLLAKLKTIQQKVMKGQLDAAANEMGAFVNEVQAQVGKKISEPAANALIAKAQAVAADLMAGVTSVGETAVAATPQPTDATPSMTKPTPMGDLLEHQVQWDAIAQQVVQSVGVSTFTYDLYQLPANSAWDDTVAYYKTEAAVAGWGDAPSQTNEMAGGHYAVWSVTGSDGTTNYFIVAQVDAPNGIFTLNIIGNK
jgi:hypothetical protein